MNSFDDNMSDDDKQKMTDYLNQQPAQDAQRQARADALQKMMAQPNPDTDRMMEGMAMGAIGPAEAVGKEVGGELMGVAQEYSPQALQEAKQAVQSAMNEAKGAYWDPAVKAAQSRFNTLSDIMRQRGGK